MKIKAQEELLAGQTRELALIERRINDYNAAVSSAQGLSQVERLILSTQLSLFEQQRGQLLEQQAETRQLLELARQVERGRVLTTAVATKVPARSPKSSIVAGAVIGLLVGIALALLWTPLVASRRTPTSSKMVDRQLSHLRMAAQTRRQAAPSPLSRLLALPAGDGTPWLGLTRPRRRANYRPTI